MRNINNSKLRIIPLGGLEQIGMNITAFEFEDSIVVVAVSYTHLYSAKTIKIYCKTIKLD